MRVVAPRGGDKGYFMRDGILCSAPIDAQARKIDLEGMVVVDYFAEDTDIEEAMNALDLLEKHNEEYQ